MARDFPRIFVFDCCEGNRALGKGVKRKKNNTQTTHTALVKGDGDDEEKQDANLNLTRQPTWNYGEDNPDFKLAELNASNPDYISYTNTLKGSYLIQGFYDRAVQCLEKKRDLILSDVFKEVQRELSKEKQLPVYTWNNGVEYVRLKKNKGKIDERTSDACKAVVEMEDISLHKRQLSADGYLSI